MTVSLGPGGQPAVSVVDLRDTTIASRGFELLTQDAVQLQSKPLHVRRVTVLLGDAAVVFHSNNLPIRTQTTTRMGVLTYALFGAETTGTVDGLAVSPGLLVAAAPGAQVRLVSDAGWQSITLMLRPEFIAAHMAARQRTEEFRMPSGVEQLHASAATVRQLFDWGKRLVDAAAAEPEPFNDHPARRAAAQVELVETLLTTLRETAGREPDRQGLARREQGRVVKIAEDHALAHVGERVHVSELCRVTEVSERTLEYAFKETLGLTPVAYLARLRLHRVRGALQTDTPGSRTVSAVALEWGFWHFGEFSRAYRACFGELPSETLRRQRVGPLRQPPP